MAPEDAEAVSMHMGERVAMHSVNGASMEFRVRIDAIEPRNVQAFWPEANPLVRRRICDASSGIPDYNGIVEIMPMRAAEPGYVFSSVRQDGSFSGKWYTSQSEHTCYSGCTASPSVREALLSIMSRASRSS
jgi:hypothetical protein